MFIEIKENSEVLTEFIKKAHKCLEDIFLSNFEDSIESNYLRQILFSLDYSEELCDDIKKVNLKDMRTEEFINKYRGKEKM